MGAMQAGPGPHVGEEAGRRDTHGPQGGRLRNATEIEPTEHTILACGCGELLIVLGGEDEWRSEGQASFECGACDSRITLPEHEDGDQEQRGQGRAGYRELSIGELVKELKAKKTG